MSSFESSPIIGFNNLNSEGVIEGFITSTPITQQRYKINNKYYYHDNSSQESQNLFSNSEVQIQDCTKDTNTVLSNEQEAELIIVGEEKTLVDNGNVFLSKINTFKSF